MNILKWAGELAHRLRELTVLTDDQGLVPSTPARSLQQFVAVAPGNPGQLRASKDMCICCAYLMQSHTHTVIKSLLKIL